MSNEKKVPLGQRAQRRHQQADLEFMSLKCGANRLFRGGSRVQEALRSMVEAVTWMSFEASKLVNLHLLSLLASDRHQELPAADRFATLIDQAFQLVSSLGTAEADDVATYGKRIDPALAATYTKLYLPCRPSTLARPSRKNLTPIRQAARELYLTNCQNHVVTNFRPRTRQFLLLMLTLEAPSAIKLQAKDRWRAVDAMYVQLIRAEPDDVKTFSTKIPGDIDSKHLHARILDFRNDLPVAGISKRSLSAHWPGFLRWFHVMQRMMAKHKHPVHGHPYRLFTLLPEHNLHAKYITLNNSSLGNLFHRIPSLKDEKDVGWDKVVNLNAVFGRSIKSWDKADNGRGWTFQHNVRTDGVSCSVLFGRKKHAKQQQEDMEEDAQLDPAMSDATMARRITETFRPVQLTAATPVWGVDPGRRDLLVATNGQRSNGRFDTIRITNKEFQHQAGTAPRRQQMEKWMAQVDKHYASTMPSSKVSTVDTYQIHLRSALASIPRFLPLFMKRNVRRLRWKGFMQRQRALDAACLKLTRKDPSTVLAFGAAGFSSTSRGHAPGPVRALRKRLARHAKMVLIDEFRTSKCCCQCHQELTAPRLHSMVKKKKKRPPDKDDGDVKMSEEKKDDEPTKSRISIHGVRVCTHKSCPTTWWNRDVNAAENIRQIFLHMNDPRHLGRRPEAFQRGT